MKNKKIIAFTLTAILLAIGIFLVKNNMDRTPTNANTIKVGSKDFTENLVVAEIYALALENNNYHVERIFNISSSLIHNAIVNNEIDIYPEYTGTGLLAILKERMETDPNKVYEIVKSKYKEKYDLIWLNYALANDSQGLVISTDVAEKLEIKNITDLQKHAPKLRFASQGEFDQREDGIKGLESVYGKFLWKSSTVYENSLKYSILSNNEADVTPAYTTEGQLVKKDKYTLLEDDKKFWPPYNLAPVVRNKIYAENPSIEGILNKISAALDTDTITELNAKIDVEGKEYKAVAKEFYDKIK